MAIGDIIKCTVSVEQVRHYKDNFGIVLVSLDKTKLGTPIVDKNNCFIVKGIMPQPELGMQYYLTAKEVEDVKYGKQYESMFMGTTINIAKDDKVGQKKFLINLFTSSQVEAMYEALPDPYDSFFNGRIEDLVKVKGCGMINASKWMQRFNDKVSISRIYIELEEYNLTPNFINKLLEHYGSADLVIQNIKENPYLLCNVSGIGWKKADAIALAGGIEPYSVERIQAFMIHYLSAEAENGYSYIPESELMGALEQNIGMGISDDTLRCALHSTDKFWRNEKEKIIGLKRYRVLEEKIAKEVLRLLNAPNQFNYKNWEQKIKHKEQQQEWKYTEQQMEGIKLVLENQFCVITGFPGTGKTSIVDGILSIFKDYSFAQTALSGRAASRMAEVTKHEGYTIHRLLAYPDFEHGKQGFGFHDECQLPYDILIIDEISMIDGYLFYYLIRAIKTGAKIILLGDVGQLESIGCLNIAADLISSLVIPTVTLTQIHRQAQNSAIITESKKVRENVQIIPKDWVGVETRGVLQDLTIDCYSDASNTFYKILQYVSSELENITDIMELQVIVPIKSKGSACTWFLNNAIQELYNPKDKTKDEITVYYAKDQVGILRVGDKVINMKNNYKTVLYKSTSQMFTPIYNGNMGIITQINIEQDFIVVYFNDIGEILISHSDYKNIELGYAITGYKSQGSQWDTVICGLDYSAYTLLTKEQVNTIMTRAKKKCILVAQNTALRFAVSQNSVSNKKTHLVSILDELAHPKIIF